MSAIIISAYPACGKSTFFNKHSKYAENGKGKRKILDSDSSKFHWVYDEEGNKLPNPEFPTNYIQHIQEQQKEQEIIFVLSHAEVRDALEAAGIDYALVYPNQDMKSDFMDRMKQRGNTDDFIKKQNKHWSKWVSDLDKVKGPKKKYKLTKTGHKYIESSLIEEIKCDFNK